MTMLCAVLAVAFITVAFCEDFSARHALNQFRVKAKAELFAHVDRALKSDRFEAVGSLRGKELESSAYSSTGSVYQSLFINTDGTADATCSSVSVVIGYVVNQCVVNPGYQLTSDSCNGGLIQYFADQKCTNYIGSSSFDASVNVCAVTQDPQAEPNQYQKMQCTTSPSPPFPTNTLAGEFYEDATCSGAALEYEGFTLNKCFNVGKYFAEYSCAGEHPSVSVYDVNTCTGKPIDIESFDNQCFLETDDFDDPYVDPYLPPIFNPPPTASTTSFPTVHGAARSTAVFCTAEEPTLKPAFAPTVYPTSSANHDVWFEVTQVITGVKASTFKSNDANSLVLIKTIAGTMTRVPTTAVTKFEVTDAPTSAARLGLQASVAGALAATASAIQVQYTVRLSTGLSGEQLWGELSSAVTSGSFNSDLFANALNSNTDLQGCTSSSASSRHFSDDPADSLTGEAIFGVVVGGLFMGAVAVGAIYLVFLRKEKGVQAIPTSGSFL